mmetsp:Transcript_23641/g.20566  ORF Transcript_23641/g.20566 Transcript_23641/m.20566 type:complete len:83 (+) Transcript_23641:909-1157(+)
MSDGGFVISWKSMDEGREYSVLSQRYSVGSTKIGQIIELVNTDDVVVATASGLSKDNYVVFWEQVADNNVVGAYAQKFNGLN